MKMKHVIVITIFMLFSIALLSSEVLGDEYVASLNVSFSSNGDILSVGFSSTDPTTSGIKPISTINLKSELGFDSSGKMTIVGKAVFYPYWQIQKNAPYRIIISRDERLIGSTGGELTYSAILNDSTNSIDPSSGEMTLYNYNYTSDDYNTLVKGSIKVSVETANAFSLPYGTSLSGNVTFTVEAL